MARKSKVDRLPAEIRDEIGRLRENGRTIDEILDKLRELGVLETEVSRPSLGRWTKRWDETRERINSSRMAAEAIMARLEATGSDKRVAELNIAALHANVMELMAGEDGEPVTLDPKSAKTISEILKNLATAAKSDQDRIMIELKREAMEEARTAAQAAAEAAIDRVATKRGLSAEVRGDIKAEFLGIAQ